MNDENRNISIDIFRVIACIGVVLIHRMLPGEIGGIIKAVSRGGVAFFFVISGYFFYSSGNLKRNQILVSRLKKTFKLLFFALIFYFMWEAALRLAGSGIESSVYWVKDWVLNINTWLYTLMWDNDPLAGHLWFLFALIRTYVISAIILKTPLKKLIYIIPIIDWVSILIMEYVGLSIAYYRNGWFYGLAFFLCGYSIALKREDIDKYVSIKVSFFIMLSGIVLTIIEYFIFDAQQMYVGTIFITVGLFFIANNMKVKNNTFNNEVAKIGMKYTSIVYILHWAVIDVFSKMDKEFAFTSMEAYRWINPILIVILSFILSGFVYEVWNKIIVELRKRCN